MSVISRARRWVRYVVLFVAAGLAFMALGLAANGWLDRGQQPQAFPPTGFPVLPGYSSATTAPSPEPVSASPDLASPVRLMTGIRVADGIRLGYPPSLAGAVSAAASFTPAIIGTLDPGQAAQAMRLVADPSFPQGPAQAAQGVTGIRLSLGLQASGPVPAGVSWAVVPEECQVRGVSADRVTVLLLMDLDSTVPGAGAITRAIVFPVALHWAAGDWKVLPTPATDYSQLTAAPGSEQAAALGWLELAGSRP
jgi:hypothetical protein